MASSIRSAGRLMNWLESSAISRSRATALFERGALPCASDPGALADVHDRRHDAPNRSQSSRARVRARRRTSEPSFRRQDGTSGAACRAPAATAVTASGRVVDARRRAPARRPGRPTSSVAGVAELPLQLAIDEHDRARAVDRPARRSATPRAPSRKRQPGRVTASTRTCSGLLLRRHGGQPHRLRANSPRPRRRPPSARAARPARACPTRCLRSRLRDPGRRSRSPPLASHPADRRRVKDRRVGHDR